jgi:hypothetical protein
MGASSRLWELPRQGRAWAPRWRPWEFLVSALVWTPFTWEDAPEEYAEIVTGWWVGGNARA